MAKPKPTPLPKRFQPLFAQAQTETALRYGAQEDALGALLQRTSGDYQKQALAQQDAGRSLLGSLNGASTDLNRVYSDAGLTPTLLAQIGNSPTGQRLAAELARGQAGIQQQQLGAKTGQQYIQKSLFDDYQDAAGQIGGQVTSLGKEKGLFQSQLLDQLIGSDRSARSQANAAARAQLHDDQQKILDRATSTANTLIPQGFLPAVGADGSITLGDPLPGGKADPNSPTAKKKRTSGPGTASPDAQRSAGNDFKKAASLAKGLMGSQAVTPEIRQVIASTLTNGKPASTGKVIYEEVPVLGSNGQPTGKTKRQPKLDASGQQVTSKSRPALPSFDAPIATAATEQALYGYVTTSTVRELQKLGYSVNQIPGLKTENQARASRPKDTRDYARPGKAKSRDQQPG